MVADVSGKDKIAATVSSTKSSPSDESPAQSKDREAVTSESVTKENEFVMESVTDFTSAACEATDEDLDLEKEKAVLEFHPIEFSPSLQSQGK